MKWLWVARRFDGKIRTEWTARPKDFYHTPIVETERFVCYEWGGDTRFLIREDLLSEVLSEVPDGVFTRST